MPRHLMDEVLAEVERARAKHGLQHELPSFPATGTRGSDDLRRIGSRLEIAARKGLALPDASWADILLEEVGEALQERDPAKLRAELVQVVAMGLCWIDKLDADAAKGEP